MKLNTFKNKFKLSLIGHVLSVIALLLSILSLICIVYASYEISQLEFNLAPESFRNYLSIFLQYKEIFSGTILILAIYFALQQFVVAAESKKQSFVISYRGTWSTILLEKLKELKPHNIYLYKNILLHLNHIFDHVSRINFQFKDKNDLESFFNEFFIDSIQYYELYDAETKKYSGVYLNPDSFYSYDKTLDILLTIAIPSRTYDNFESDFKNLFFKAISTSKILIRNIDPEEYKRIKRDWLNNAIM